MLSINGNLVKGMSSEEVVREMSSSEHESLCLIILPHKQTKVMYRFCIDRLFFNVPLFFDIRDMACWRSALILEGWWRSCGCRKLVPLAESDASHEFFLILEICHPCTKTLTSFCLFYGSQFHCMANKPFVQ